MDMNAIYDDAVAYVQKQQDRSCVGLQRHLRIGYTLAKRLRERMEKNGVFTGIKLHVEPTNVAIKVVGVGSAGCNALEEVIRQAPPGVGSIAVNLDARALTRSTAQKTIHIGICELSILAEASQSFRSR